MKEKPAPAAHRIVQGGSADAKDLTKSPEDIERHRQQRMKAEKKKHA